MCELILLFKGCSEDRRQFGELKFPRTIQSTSQKIGTLFVLSSPITIVINSTKLRCTYPQVYNLVRQNGVTFSKKSAKLVHAFRPHQLSSRQIWCTCRQNLVQCTSSARCNGVTKIWCSAHRVEVAPGVMVSPKSGAVHRVQVVPGVMVSPKPGAVHRVQFAPGVMVSRSILQTPSLPTAFNSRLWTTNEYDDHKPCRIELRKK